MMITKNYSFAGIELQISMAEEMMYTNDRYLSPFLVDSVSDPHVFTFEFCESLPAPAGRCVIKTPAFCVYDENGISARYIGSVTHSWKDGYICAQHSGKNHRVLLKKSQFTDRVGTHTVLTAIAAEHLITQADGVIFHCSYIEHNGKAILFTAPSETGKSTQADLWHKYRGADIVNGDRAAIRETGGQLYADGIPFSGSSAHCHNRTLPLAAIVYLGQAPATSVHRLKGYQAFAKVWEGVSINTWDSDDMQKASALVKKIAESIPVFHMPCTPDENAVIALEKALEGEI